ncbi:MAG: Maff2 family protein [Dysosmobacter sp.]|nr:Maff2 family protein [Dysosmobacter sp.]MDY5612896.1 Maff2 family protein [Dysosmobacter sp.]
MEFFASAVDTLKVLVMAIGCGLGAWGIVNLLEGYGADNPASKCFSTILFLFLS